MDLEIHHIGCSYIKKCTKQDFILKTVEESCECFAVIDQEVVWYGNINLLAKDRGDDSIMRVLSNEIAGELMKITFGNNS